MPTYKSLADLKRYSKDMKARAKAEEAARAEQAAKDARSREGAAFFKHAMAELGVARANFFTAPAGQCACLHAVHVGNFLR